MNKGDKIFLGGIVTSYTFITALALWSPIALQSLAIAIFLVAIGFKIYCMNRNCVVICKFNV